MSNYIEYRGFKYSQVAVGKWVITLPSGLRNVVEALDEEALKALIDSLVVP